MDEADRSADDQGPVDDKQREEGQEQQTEAAPKAAQDEPAPDYMEDKTNAYLAYILRETELVKARTEKTSKNTSIIIGLLALQIVVLIMIWLDQSLGFL
jgi:cobalamin biosynthesis Mg chelatase CobN